MMGLIVVVQQVKDQGVLALCLHEPESVYRKDLAGMR